MKKILLIIIICILTYTISVNAMLPLSGKDIVIDIGHGGKDVGTSYENIYEKNINLDIGKKLKNELLRNGAGVIMIRDDDYDLASPGVKLRKRSDFDNRIKLINESGSNLYVSIHTNYLSDSSYYGAQVFYYGEQNKNIAENIQSHLNNISYPRSVKKMPNVYMYQRLKIKGALVEVGFLSNDYERNKLIDNDYQNQIAHQICEGIISYYN